jgi:hypothetical protein
MYEFFGAGNVQSATRPKMFKSFLSHIRILSGASLMIPQISEMACGLGRDPLIIQQFAVEVSPRLTFNDVNL